METALRRRVLIIEEEASIRNALYVLLASAGRGSDGASSGRQALAMVSRGSFDAILLDLRCRNLSPDGGISEIEDLSPRLVGRVLVITGEVANPMTLDWIQRSCLAPLPSHRLAEDLGSRVKTLLNLTRVPKPAV